MFCLSIQSCGFVGTQVEPRLKLSLAFGIFPSFLVSIFLNFRDVVLRAFENRVLRKIFGPKRDEVTGEWRKLHNE
jgi:hypothetical protein